MDPKVEQLHLRANFLIAEFKEEGEASYIDGAIDLDREALKLCPYGAGHTTARAVSLTLLAIHLGDRYDELGEREDIEEAIILDQEVLDLCPQEHHDRLVLLKNLAAHLASPYQQFGAMHDIERAIHLGQEALRLYKQGAPDPGLKALNNLGVHLSVRYKQLGAMEDIDQAIVLGLQVLDHCPEEHSARSSYLNNLAAHLSERYDKSGAMEDLDAAIVFNREALKLRQKRHIRTGSLNNLASCLSTRYNQLGEMEDIDEAIDLGREALDLFPQGHRHQSMPLSNLAVHLATRYSRLGVMGDFNAAIDFDQQALKFRPEGHLYRSRSLHNLTVHLSTRYEQLVAMEDLDKAINLEREALALCPPGHRNRPSSLDNLADCLFIRYKELGMMEDLDKAIGLEKEALTLRLERDPGRSTSLNNLGICLSTRYNETGALQNLSDGIHLGRNACDSGAETHPLRSSRLSNLAGSLSIRYGRLGAKEDLDLAISLERAALNLRPRGHSGRSASLNNLAGYLRDRFTRRNQLQDKQELFSLYAQLVHVPQIVSSVDLSAAKAWIDAAEAFQHPMILLAYETSESLRLLIQHLDALPSLPQHRVIVKNVTSSLAVDAFSACLRDDASSPVRAVELLEQGRGVFWNQRTRLRFPLDDLIGSGSVGEKRLADEFTRLASLTRSALDSPGADQHDHLCHLHSELKEVAAKGRSLEIPNLSRFLLPLLYSDLRFAASGGPVIIVNASKDSCDTLIVFLDRDPVRIPLHITQKDVRELSKELHTFAGLACFVNVTSVLAFILRMLWDQIVSPIVDILRTTHPSQSRIWWCSTAEFSVLPLHAAGPYRNGEQNLPDLYISSYTPTLTALICAKRDPSNSATERKRFIAIGQANAPGESELPFVGVELDNIRPHVNGPATFTRIDGEEASTSRVVEELGKNEWVHLACHGVPNREQPFESAFALHDGHLTIQRIIGCDLKNPEFAYLSACHTTVGDEESLDEAIHLASAMQFIGFRSVIGTMWAVNDAVASEIAPTFYEYMVDESGRLDQRGVRAERDDEIHANHIPSEQKILCVHIGA